MANPSVPAASTSPTTTGRDSAPFARAATAVLVILAMGFVGLVASFSDLSLGESLVRRLTFLTAVFLVGGSFVGFLLPRHWYLSGLTAWGPLLMGVVSLYAKLRFPEPALDGKMSDSVVMLLVPPAVGLAGGLLGRRLARRVQARR